MNVEELIVIPIVLIVFGSIVVGLCIVCWTLVRLFTGGGRGGQVLRTEESKMIQEIYKGLTKMEQRVETLETLLLERDGKGNKS